MDLNIPIQLVSDSLRDTPQTPKGRKLFCKENSNAEASSFWLHRPKIQFVEREVVAGSIAAFAHAQ